MARLSVQDVHYHFGRHRVLRGVDLTAEDGQCVALFGRNGAGKSTLLSILSTRRRPAKGTYILDGLMREENREEMRARLIFLGHHTHIYGHLTALENLRFFADLRGLDAKDDQLQDAVAMAGLERASHRPASGFSAGMRKRLALARVVLVQPSLLLLDEPYSALDVQGVEWLNGMLRQYLHGGGTLILTSHDPERVAQIPHRPEWIEKGRITVQSHV